MSRERTIFRLAKGYRGRAKNCFRIAIKRVEKGLQNAYRERRLKKREARSTQILQVGAGSREHGLTYSKLIRGLYLSDIGLNRKMLSAIARQEPYSFRAIVEEVRTAMRCSLSPFSPGITAFALSGYLDGTLPERIGDTGGVAPAPRAAAC